jgi:hypothetical protein
MLDCVEVRAENERNPYQYSVSLRLNCTLYHIEVLKSSSLLRSVGAFAPGHINDFL